MLQTTTRECRKSLNLLAYHAVIVKLNSPFLENIVNLMHSYFHQLFCQLFTISLIFDCPLQSLPIQNKMNNTEEQTCDSV